MASETDALLPRGPRVNGDEAEASAPAAAHAGPASGEEKEEEADSLTFGDRMLFSFPFLSLNLMLTTLNTWLVYFWLPPAADGNLIGSLGFSGAAFLGRLIEGVWGVQIGYFSDRLVSSMGRRRPFLLFGTPLLVVAYVSLWFPPTPAESPANTAYLICMYVFFGLVTATVTTPYQASIPEITTTPRQRFQLTAAGGIFAIFGHILAAFIGPLIYFTEENFPEGITVGPITFVSGLQIWSLFVGLMIFGYLLPTVVLSRRGRVDPSATVPQKGAFVTSINHDENDKDEAAGALITATKQNVWQEVLHVSRNYVFLAATMSINVLTPSANLVLVANLPYFFEAVIETENGIVQPGTGNLWLGLGILITVVGSLVGVPIIGRLARAYGKRRVLIFSNLCVALSALCFFLSHLFDDPAILGLTSIVLIAIPSASFFTLPNAIYADVVDEDFVKTGVRREGVYAGAGRLWNRVGMAIAQVIFTWILSFGKTPDNNTGVIYNTLFSSGLFALSSISLYFYPIDK